MIVQSTIFRGKPSSQAMTLKINGVTNLRSTVDIVEGGSAAIEIRKYLKPESQ
jgi:hypothetical protein